ncbi:MAG: hypothetical protein IT447_00445 [Phycisphaerales bacterium]|nr:hypothetical protein [Phycisphaerales bacterium]
MSLPAEISLLTAALDLKLIQMLRQAMQPAGQSTGGLPVVQTPAAIYEPRQHLHPTPRIEPRMVYHPTPRIEPRLVYHPTPDTAPAPPPAAPLPPPCKPFSPIPPVWKKLPPIHHEQSAGPKIKVVHRPPDIIHKGSLIDFFM